MKKDNEVIELIEGANWIVTGRNQEEHLNYAISGYATTFTDKEYLIIRSSNKIGNQPSSIWYVTEFEIRDNKELYVTGLVKPYLGMSIHEVVEKFNSSCTSTPDIFGMSPIKKLAIPQTFYTLTYNEDGEWDNEMFRGSLDELKYVMTHRGWNIPMDIHTDEMEQVYAIGITDAEHAVCIVKMKPTKKHPIVASVVNVCLDGTYAGISCAVPIVGTNLEEAIRNHNKIILDSNVGNEIIEYISRDGDHVIL